MNMPWTLVVVWCGAGAFVAAILLACWLQERQTTRRQRAWDAFTKEMFRKDLERVRKK
jgi:hypothetical protein